jgi:uncharacterized protein
LPKALLDSRLVAESSHGADFTNTSREKNRREPRRAKWVKAPENNAFRMEIDVIEEPMAPPDDVVREILRALPVIAMVGASARPGRPSHDVMSMLLHEGYRVVPVHPTYPTVHGLPVYRDLASIPGPVDLVDVFRRPEFAPEVARQAVAKGAKVLWLQLGVVSWEAWRIAREGGLTVVMDRCLSVEHYRLLG